MRGAEKYKSKKTLIQCLSFFFDPRNYTYSVSAADSFSLLETFPLSKICFCNSPISSWSHCAMFPHWLISPKLGGKGVYSFGYQRRPKKTILSGLMSRVFRVHLPRPSSAEEQSFTTMNSSRCSLPHAYILGSPHSRQSAGCAWRRHHWKYWYSHTLWVMRPGQCYGDVRLICTG